MYNEFLCCELYEFGLPCYRRIGGREGEYPGGGDKRGSEREERGASSVPSPQGTAQQSRGGSQSTRGLRKGSTSVLVTSRGLGLFLAITKNI